MSAPVNVAARIGATMNHFHVTAPSITQFENLSPDALMYYCASKLRDVDTEVDVKFKEQKKSIAEKQVWSKAKEALGSYTEIDDQNAVNKITADLKQAQAEMQRLNPEAAKKIQALIDKINHTGTDAPTDAKVSKEQVQFCRDQIEDAVKDLNANAELNMIQLQSLMSQRQQAIQICTNLVQALGQQQNSIAQNVGK
jgi:hypothetical protein